MRQRRLELAATAARLTVICMGYIHLDPYPIFSLALDLFSMRFFDWPEHCIDTSAEKRAEGLMTAKNRANRPHTSCLLASCTQSRGVHYQVLA